MAENLKLKKAATTALRDFMGLSSDEVLLVISDEKLRDIGVSLFEAGKEIANEAFYVEIKSRHINGEEPPSAIADLMKNVDVVVCPTSKSLTHTDARIEASNLGVRVGTMPGITEDTLIRCLSANPDKIVSLSQLVFDQMRKTYKVKVTSKLGTDLQMSIRRRRIYMSTGVLTKVGESGNIPSGEVYVSPWEAKSNGIVVVDGSVAGIGIIKNPIEIEIRDGYAESIKGKEEANKLQRMLEGVGPDAFSLAEFGVGTNYKAKIVGDILEDEKVLGTIHVAFGNNASMGGRVNVKCHIDCIVKKPTVYFDDFLVLDNGKMMIGDNSKPEE